ncbi:hypothetical protein SBRCBS47491_006089 [Sporothrix bragantina]|uniref:Uncharacterized protein n=1 Tax=Sporothrix bragantina TaxID=671064 RepID=A0ABP0C404_9PEZI
MFTTTASATAAATTRASISTSATPVTATNPISTGRAKENEKTVPGHRDAALDSEDSAADGRAGRSHDQASSSAPRTGHQDAPTSTMTTTTASPSSPSPAKRPKPHRRGLDSAKAACAGGDRGHQVTRPSPLRSMMTAT